MKKYEEQQVSKLKLKDWAAEDRPVEKMIMNGSGALSNAELLACMIGTGSADLDALEVAKLILSKAENNLNELGKLSIDVLLSFPSVGKQKATAIVAAIELGKRRRSEAVVKRIQIRNSRDIYESIHAKMADLDHEECWVLLMNNQHRIIELVRISHGGVSETTVDPKIVLKAALGCLASSVVLIHNHPSGNPYPSSCDDKITQKIKLGCQNLDIQLTDHLIFSESSYYSYADEGKL